VWGSDTGGGGDFVWAYTAQFGNGLSATISAEAEDVRSTTHVTAFVLPAAQAVRTGYAGRQLMDLVGNVRIDQAWGSAQIMGALHEVRPSTAVGDDEWGYAIGAGLTLNLPMIGKGDTFSIQGTYSEGAVRYAGAGVGAPGFLITKDAISAIGVTYDAVSTGSTTHLTEAWSVVAGFQHVWNPKWKTSLYGTYGEVNFSAAANAILLAGRDASWSMWQAGSRTVWTVVPNLDLSVDVMYNSIDTGFGGAPTGTTGAPAVAGDVDWWQGMFRVQRNFYP
jgi:hypothetical protein